MNKRNILAVHQLLWLEGWSSFARYGIRSLFIMYVTHELLFNDSRAYTLYATFSSLLFLTPILGGFLADRYLGCVHAILLGCGIMIGGLILLPFKSFFYIALGLIILGYGFLKTNITSLLGQLYPAQQSHEREKGYIFLYVRTNIGAFLAPIICGTFGQYFGWEFGFASLAIGMIVGSFLFLKSIDTFLNHLKNVKWSHIIAIYSGSIALIFGITELLKNNHLINYFGFCLFIVIIGVMAYIALRSTSQEKKTLLKIIGIFSVYSIVTAFGEQSASSLYLFVDRFVDRQFLNKDLPTTYFLALNPIFIIMLSPLVSKGLDILNFKGIKFSVVQKLIIGVSMQGLGFLMLFVGIHFTNNVHISPLWIFLCYFLDALGEFFIFPVVTAFVSRHAPKQYAHTLMGSLFLFSALGFYVGGLISQRCTDPTLGNLSFNQSRDLYGQVFLDIALFSGALGVILSLFILRKKLKISAKN